VTSKPPKFADALELFARAAAGDAHKLAGLAARAHDEGLKDDAYRLARQARALAPADPEVVSRTADAIAGGVPRFHFGMIADHERNRLYQEAIERAVRPGMRVLDIGAGSGLLAMMAARAGAGEVVTVEGNLAVADAAREIVALNGMSDRVRVVHGLSTDLDVEADLGGRFDLIVSEIISDNLIGEGALASLADAARRMLNPGGAMIPRRGWVRVALADWETARQLAMGEVCGFDLTPFNRLAGSRGRVKAHDSLLAMRGDALDLFDFDLTAEQHATGGQASLETVATSPANGVVQWIRIDLDGTSAIENAPGPETRSHWSCLWYPARRDIAAGERVTVRAAHDGLRIRTWVE